MTSKTTATTPAQTLVINWAVGPGDEAAFDRIRANPDAVRRGRVSEDSRAAQRREVAKMRSQR